MRTDRIRALYVQPAPYFGGAERQATTIVPLLRAFGVDVVPVVGPGATICQWLRQQGVTDFVHTAHLPGAWPKQRGLARATLPWRYGGAAAGLKLELVRILAAAPIDVIVASLPFAWLVATPIARRTGIPILWRAGGCNVNAAQRALLSLVTTRLRPDLLLCNSNAVERTFAPLVRVPSRVIPNGVDLDAFRPGAGTPSRFRPPGARLVVGFASRLDPHKRPGDFIELAARLAPAYPDVHFLLAGDGSQRPAHQARARRLAARHLRFSGYVDDMPSFLAACDVLVVPSRSEGCPNVVLEAMASKSIVVAADNPGVRELIDDGRHGLLYPTGEVTRLADLVRRLAGDRELGHRIAESAYRRVRSHFSAESCAGALADLLRASARGDAAGAPGRPGTGPRPRPPRASGRCATAPAPSSGSRTPPLHTRRADR
jgi:glycosyltransferase involved in cell wall biosynthesis